MNLVSVRFITTDVARLVAFYERVTGRAATWFTEDFAELASPTSTLAIGSTRTMQLFGAVAPTPGSGAAIVEFRTDDVDADYTRLASALTDVVQTPTTMPWGNRSLLFRDPDGNLVNLFTPVTPDAIARAAR